jgi:secreted trypsin-like serine protease
VLALSALALACALAPAASASSVSPKIVHGSDVTDITQFPFQVLLFEAGTDPSTPDGLDPGGRLCGGVIKDATHIITAAHCVFDVFKRGQVSPPSDLQVFAGSADLTDAGATIKDVSDIAFDPHYDPSTNIHDVALITLASPLTLGTQGTDPMAPIAFASTMPADDSPLIVTGWGDMTAEPPDGSGTPTFSNTLQQATVPLVNDTTCSTEYGNAGSPVDTTFLFCAGDNNPPPVEDSCQGDSGGPIVTGTSGAYELLGLVDSGIGCAQAGFPGIYTRLVNPELQSFLNNPSLPDAPSQNSATTLSGAGAAGQTLTCATGDWSGSPSFTYQFFRLGSSAPLTNASPTGNTYTIQQSDVGTRIQCEVQASNGGGYGFGESNSVLVPVPPPPPPPPPGPPKDTTPPKLKLNHKGCTRTSCTLKMTVTDQGTPSSGVARVKATLSYTKKVSCRKHGRRTTCKKHVRRSLKATAGSGGKFTIVIKHLASGKGYTIALLPFDNAGNHPQFSTITNVRTKSRHPSGLF